MNRMKTWLSVKNNREILMIVIGVIVIVFGSMFIITANT